MAENLPEVIELAAPPVDGAHPPRPPQESRSIQQTTEMVKESGAWLKALRMEMSKAVIGQDQLVTSLCIGLLSGGHILLEGLPGLAKTLAVKTLAGIISCDFRRLQFTPDMLPADIIGTEIYNPQQTSFEVKKGPIFSSIILADEINRAPAKVQSALLEAMQEKQITIGSTTFSLPELFLVLATQNPIEQEGTYPLPEAQVDRFMMKVVVTYPSFEEERRILDTFDSTDQPVLPQKVINPAQLLESRKVVNSIYMDEKIRDYIVSLVHATREPGSYRPELRDLIETGGSPRATLNLKIVSRCMAFLRGRGFVTPDDVKEGAMEVLRHRIRVSYEAEAEGVGPEDIIRTILDTVPVP